MVIRKAGLVAELEELVGDLLGEPWDKGKGCPRELTLREALIVASGYARNNMTEEVWGEIFDVDQSTISRYITFLTPLIDDRFCISLIEQLEFRTYAAAAVQAAVTARISSGVG